LPESWRKPQKPKIEKMTAYCPHGKSFNFATSQARIPVRVQDFLKWLHEANVDAGASVLGVIISLIGFIVTIMQVVRSKTAAEKAAMAASEIRDKLTLQTVATDLSTLMVDIEEIKQAHRSGAWAIMPIKYSSVRQKLFAVKANCPSLTKTQKATIQGIIEQFKDIEEIVETAMADKRSPTDVAGLNKVASAQGDKLTEVLVAVQQEITNK
jgi:hypothetical protein